MGPRHRELDPKFKTSGAWRTLGRVRTGRGTQKSERWRTSSVGLGMSRSLSVCHSRAASARPICLAHCPRPVGTSVWTGAGYLERASPVLLLSPAAVRLHQRPPILPRATTLSAAVRVVYVRRAVLPISALADARPIATLVRARAPASCRIRLSLVLTSFQRLKRRSDSGHT